MSSGNYGDMIEYFNKETNFLCVNLVSMSVSRLEGSSQCQIKSRKSISESFFQKKINRRQKCEFYSFLYFLIEKKYNQKEGVKVKIMKAHFPVFSNFSRININPRAHILSKTTSIIKINATLMPIFCQKTSILSRKWCSHVIFFQNFSENTPYCQAYYIWSKNVNSVKTTLF